MGEWKKAILFRHPEIVPGVILVVVGIDNDRGMECIQEFEKSISTVSESRIDQQPVYKKGINLKKREARKQADHSNRIHGTLRHKMHRNPIHA